MMQTILPTAQQAKEQAKRLRAAQAETGQTIGHAQALEQVARTHGFRDWNTMSAAISSDPNIAWAIGDTVSGTYLAQAFTGKVVQCEQLSPGWTRLELHLDAAVDVVTSDHFSNMRTRVRGVVGPKGHSAEHTSDGHPQLHIDLPRL